MFSSAYEISTHFLKLFAILIRFHRKARHCFCYSLLWSWRGLAACLALMVHTVCHTCIIWWHYWHTQPTFLPPYLSPVYKLLHGRESSSWYNANGILRLKRLKLTGLHLMRLVRLWRCESTWGFNLGRQRHQSFWYCLCLAIEAFLGFLGCWLILFLYDGKWKTNRETRQ